MGASKIPATVNFAHLTSAKILRPPGSGAFVLTYTGNLGTFDTSTLTTLNVDSEVQNLLDAIQEDAGGNGDSNVSSYIYEVKDGVITSITLMNVMCTCWHTLYGPNNFQRHVLCVPKLDGVNHPANIYQWGWYPTLFTVPI